MFTQTTEEPTLKMADLPWYKAECQRYREATAAALASGDQELYRAARIAQARHTHYLVGAPSSLLKAENAPQAVPTKVPIRILQPVDDIFENVVQGENRLAFTQIEYLVNEMRQAMTTQHLGLFGPPSVGKTLTAGIVARSLERPYYEGNAMSLNGHSNPLQALVDLINQMYEGGRSPGAVHTHDNGRSQVYVLKPTVIFIDEAHELSSTAQNTLLPLMEAPFTMPFRDFYIDFRHILFILGTTDPAKLLRPLRTRVREISFVGYGADSVAQMVMQNYPQIDADAAKLIALGGKLYPRRALSIARTCSELAKHYGSATKVLRDHLSIDAAGLDPTDRRLLNALDETVVVIPEGKLQEARELLRLDAAGKRVPATALAKATALLANPRTHRPIGKAALADRIMSTDVQDVTERIGYLEQIGRVTQSSRGVQIA